MPPKREGDMKAADGKRAKKRRVQLSNILSSSDIDFSSLNPRDHPMFFPPTDKIDFSQQPPVGQNRNTASDFKMAVEPPAESIDNLVSFCEGVGSPITRADAVRYLKAKNNDVNAAFDAYFTHEDISAAEKALTWDEGVWGQGKDGDAGDGTTDPHLRPLLASGAPTRNNSPSGGVRDSMHPSSKQEEDADMQRAIQLSHGTGYSQQESGVVSASGQERQQFGPANRNDYDARQWAMIPSGQSSSNSGEIVPDAEVQERVGKAGEPRMLKPLPGQGEYLANVLTILSHVHGAKEAMLMREMVKEAGYGEDAEWWKGHSIAMPKIVALGDGGVEGVEEGDRYDDLIAEVQRVMAFLSASGRSYGSAGALAQMETLRMAKVQSVRSKTLLEAFLQTWSVAAVAKAGEDDRLEKLFTTTIGTNASEGMVESDMTLIDMVVESNPDPNKSHDLLELLDGLLWDTSDPEVPSDNYIENPADVLVMRLRRSHDESQQQLKVAVPSEFHLDKYLQQHIASTRKTRADMAKGKKKVQKIEQIERKLRMWRNPKDGKDVDASKLVGHTLRFYEELQEQQQNGFQSPDTEANEAIAAKLKAVCASIDDKLTTLTEEKEATLASISAMSRTPPPGMEPEDQEHRYILRGVATKPNITYILIQEDEDEAKDLPPFEDADDTTLPGLRWWRLQYDVSATGFTARVSKDRVGDYDVFRAVELEHGGAVLVYGSMEVNQMDDDVGLPETLRRFVERDDELFKEELEAERNKPPAYVQASFDFTGGDGNGEAGLGGKKRDSMDSLRAEPSPPDYNDGGDFAQHAGYGLGPDGLDGGKGDDVAEIRLDDNEDEGVEMVEVAHEPLIPQAPNNKDVGVGGDEKNDVDMGEG